MVKECPRKHFFASTIQRFSNHKFCRPAAFLFDLQAVPGTPVWPASCSWHSCLTCKLFLTLLSDVPQPSLEDLDLLLLLLVDAVLHPAEEVILYTVYTNNTVRCTNYDVRPEQVSCLLQIVESLNMEYLELTQLIIQVTPYGNKVTLCSSSN